MDETSRAIGELGATFVALSQRLDAMHAENIARHTDAISRVADIQAQLHEVKHSHANERVEVARLAQLVQAHQEQDKRDHDHVIETLEQHQASAAAGIAELHQEVLANRQAGAANKAATDAKIDELFSLRNKLLGALALATVVLGVFGRNLWLGASHFFGK